MSFYEPLKQSSYREIFFSHGLISVYIWVFGVITSKIYHLLFTYQISLFSSHYKPNQTMANAESPVM
jgi:hypothetical protein